MYEIFFLQEKYITIDIVIILIIGTRIEQKRIVLEDGFSSTLDSNDGLGTLGIHEKLVLHIFPLQQQNK